MLSQVILDMRYFLLVLLYSLFSFTMVMFAINGKQEFSVAGDHLTNTYRIILSDFPIMPDSEIGWVVFLLLTLINSIILLSLIISVIDDTYDRV